VAAGDVARKYRVAGMATKLRAEVTVPSEIVLGRFMACCVHPVAAWRALSTSGRCLLALAYAAVGYVAALMTLLALR
jgi:hypothetical protein